ncbi:uncharacterized protein LOC131605710 [Vicia villosa]|uniref:uncharacterized protein LOC131605710 n=1 Tax=Vicia villosa TaxID=3911 RepID=UPI00273CBEF8|nr:uncharacterized protein LOC131605710 [Vicia villosa]
MIVEGECSTCKLQDNNISSFENFTETCRDQLRKDKNQLQAAENIMMSVKEGVQTSEEWYLDFGFSMHMTRRKEWFVKIHQAMKNKVKFADDTTFTADGTGDVLIMKRDGGHSLIKDVLQISRIKFSWRLKKKPSACEDEYIAASLYGAKPCG